MANRVYAITFATSARKELESLDPPPVRRMLPVIEALAQKPRPRRRICSLKSCGLVFRPRHRDMPSVDIKVQHEDGKFRIARWIDISRLSVRRHGLASGLSYLNVIPKRKAAKLVNALLPPKFTWPWSRSSKRIAACLSTQKFTPPPRLYPCSNLVRSPK